MTEHALPHRFLERTVTVDLVGCGGNGSQMLTGLARLDRALRALGHPAGLHVTAWDPDRVSEANVGRQLFYPGDIGKSKAIQLVTRINACFGLNWHAVPEAYTGPRVHTSTSLGIRMSSAHCAEILITCVDSAKARREIHKGITGHRQGSMATPAYWLDLGNHQQDGQVILGEPVDALNKRQVSLSEFAEKGKAAKGTPLRLPTVVEIFPELLDEKQAEDNRPSCSLAEALESQDLFINDHVSREALQLLWTLFRTGKTAYHGVFTNLVTGERSRLPVPQYVPAKRARRTRRTAGATA